MSVFQNNQPAQVGGGGIVGMQNQNATQSGSVFGQEQQQRHGRLFQNQLTIQTGNVLGQQQQQLQKGGSQGTQQTTGGGLFNNGFQQQGIQQPQALSLQQQQNQPQFQSQQQQPQQQQHGAVIVNSQVWFEMKEIYQKLQNVRKDHISIEKDINVSDNNNKYAHKSITNLPKELLDGVTILNNQIADSDKQVAKMAESQKELHNSIQETRKIIQQTSQGLKQTAQHVKDIQEDINELINEQLDQKQYILHFFYAFTNSLENRQFPKIQLPQPFIIKTQEKFQSRMEKLQRQIEEVEQILQVEVTQRNSEEELAFVFIIVEQLFRYFNNVTALIYEFHKHYEEFRMKIVQIQDEREFGFANDLNETTKRALNQENRYFKQLSIISENLEKQIRIHEEETQQGKVGVDKRYPLGN